MDGFLLVVTVDGEIFFVSESVKDYLGYSQVSKKSLKHVGLNVPKVIIINKKKTIQKHLF